jgi:ABC-2 type transport system permease protein
LLYTFLFGYLYSEHVVKGIHTAVVDECNDQLSRSIIEGFRKSDKFHITGEITEAQISPLLRSGKIDAAIVIPKDFSKDIKKGTSSEILVIVNGSNMIISNTVTTYALQIIQTYSTGIAVKKVEAKGVASEGAISSANPINFRIRPWYNPTYNYTNFLLLGLIATAIQQITLLCVAVSVAKEKEHNTLPDLLNISKNPWIIVVGKTIPYFIAGLFTLSSAIAMARFVFHVPIRGSIALILLLTVAFLLGIIALGIFLSIVCRGELEATQISMLIAIPSFLFSGFTWPIQAMPTLAQWLSSILPLTYFANALRRVAIMGVGYQEVARDIHILFLLAVIFIPASVWCFKRKFILGRDILSWPKIKHTEAK